MRRASYIRVAPDSQGKRVATSAFGEGDDEVHRGEYVIADGTNLAVTAPVTATPAADAPGLVVRPIGPLTNAELRAASVPVSESQLRAALGVTTDAEATGDGPLIGIAKRLRTLLNVLTTGLNQDGSDYSMPITTAPGRAVARQRFFLAGSGRMMLTAAGNVRILLRNPAGSGRTLYIARVAGLATGTAWADFHLSPTTGLPAAGTERPKNNAVFGSPVASVASVTVDTNLTTPLGGGFNLGLTVGIPATQRISLDLPPLVISPGVSLGMNVPFAGAAEATFSIYYWEA